MPDLSGATSSNIATYQNSLLKGQQNDIERKRLELEEERAKQDQIMNYANTVSQGIQNYQRNKQTGIENAREDQRLAMDKEKQQAQLVDFTPQQAKGWEKTMGLPDGSLDPLAGRKYEGNYIHGLLATMSTMQSRKEMQQLKMQYQQPFKIGNKAYKQVLGDDGEMHAVEIASNDEMTQAAQNKQSQFSQKQFDSLLNNVQRDLGSQRNVVGASSRSNRVVNVALDRLSRPVTYQDLNAVALDLNTGITGQMATKYGKETLEYKTLQSKLANLQTYLTGEPQEVATPEVVKKFKTDLEAVKRVNDKVINGYIAQREKAHKRTIEPFKSDWDNFKEQVLSGELEQDPGAAQSGGAPGASGAPISAQGSKEEDYLRQIGAKLTPANIEWAKKKLGVQQ